MSDFPQIIKKLTVTPVVEGVSPYAKSSAVVGDISNLNEYITVPAYVSSYANPYVRQLLFQYNYSLDHDFFLTNIAQYRAYANMLVMGGVLTIKYRVDDTVKRYSLLDHRSDTDWAWFTPYTNQIIKKNFCIEFWAGALQSGEVMRALMQSLILKTSKIILRDNVSDTDTYFDIAAPPYTPAQLGFAMPEDIPTDGTLIAWLNNVYTANDLLEVTGPDLVVTQSATTYRLQLYQSGNWITVGIDSNPPQVNLEGTNLRFKSGTGPQWYDNDTGKWHTLVVADSPPRVFIDPVGEV